MKKIIFWTLLLFANCTFAQQKITIEVKDSLNLQPLPYATIQFQQGSKQWGEFVDSLGRLRSNVKEMGILTFTVRYQGYQPKSWTAVIKSDTNFYLLLTPNLVQLNEVTVQGERPLLEQKADRVVLQVSRTQERGKKVSETIRKLPFVVSTSDDLLIKGKSNFLIYKDGMPTQLSYKDLQNMSSTLLSAIEIIYYPSTRFEGEVDQIINIISSKEEQFSGGNFWTAAGLRSKAGLGPSGLGLQLTKFQGSANSDFTIAWRRENMKLGQENAMQLADNEVGQEIGELRRNTDLSAAYSKYWTLKKGNALSWGLGGDYQPKNAKSEFNSSLGPSSNTSEAHNWNGNAFFNYAKTFSNKANFYFSYLLQKNFTNYELKIVGTTPAVFATSNETNSLQNKVQVDYDWVSKRKYKFEVGSMYTLRSYRQKLTASAFDYHQNVVAGHLGVSRTFKKVFVRAGFRVEQTENRIKSDTSFSQTNLLPRILLNYAVHKNYRMNISYSHRVQRPDFRLLSQFRDVANPLFITVGNRDLKNVRYRRWEVDNSLSLGKSNLSVVFFYVAGANQISSIRTFTDHVLNLSYYNITDSKEGGLSYSFNSSMFGSKVYLFSSGSLSHFSTKGAGQTNAGWRRNVSVGFTHQVSKKWGTEFFFNMHQNTYNLQTDVKNSIYSDFILSYQAGTKSSFRFRIQNPVLDKINTKMITRAPQIYIENTTYYWGRTFELSYSYSFGKTKFVREKTKKARIDDLKVEE